MSIETARLLLTPVSEAHVDAIYQHFTEQVITYMYPTVAKHRDETLAVVRSFMQQRANRTDEVYAITLKDSGAFIGLVGLHNLTDAVPELGVWTAVATHGNHYGREAVGGVIDHARGMGIQKLCYPVDRRNIASRKIPLFYGGTVTENWREVRTPDGRTLEIERYELTL